MVEELERHKWIKKYLRRKAGTHDADLEYSMDNEMGRKFNIRPDDSEVSLRHKNAGVGESRYTTLNIIGEIRIDDR